MKKYIFIAVVLIAFVAFVAWNRKRNTPSVEVDSVDWLAKTVRLELRYKGNYQKGVYSPGDISRSWFDSDTEAIIETSKDGRKIIASIKNKGVVIAQKTIDFDSQTVL